MGWWSKFVSLFWWILHVVFKHESMTSNFISKSFELLSFSKIWGFGCDCIFRDWFIIELQACVWLSRWCYFCSFLSGRPSTYRRHRRSPSSSSIWSLIIHFGKLKVRLSPIKSVFTKRSLVLNCLILKCELGALNKHCLQHLFESFLVVTHPVW